MKFTLTLTPPKDFKQIGAPRRKARPLTVDVPDVQRTADAISFAVKSARACPVGTRLRLHRHDTPDGIPTTVYEGVHETQGSVFDVSAPDVLAARRRSSSPAKKRGTR